MIELLVLGISGSIGKQTIDIIDESPDKFRLIGASVGNNVKYLKEIILKYDSLKYVYVIDKKNAKLLQDDNPDLVVFYGDNGLKNLVKVCNVHMVVNALVGFAGFIPTITAIKKGVDVALANKESLVVGGELIKKELRKSKSKIYPIDSEHSAIYKCLKNVNEDSVKKLIITASGGSLRDLNLEELKNVTVEDVLNHPTWSMGKKITVDSATMMNKAFEVVEAYYLFNKKIKDIEVVFDYKSYVHSIVELKNKSYILEAGVPDMHKPIRNALNKFINCDEDLYFVSSKKELFAKYELQEFDHERFKLISLAKKLLKTKGNMLCIFNAANDVLVNQFLNGKISFIDIEYYIVKALENIPYKKHVSIRTLVKTNAMTIEYINNMLMEK